MNENKIYGLKAQINPAQRQRLGAKTEKLGLMDIF